MKLSLGYITFPTKKEAHDIAAGLLDKELIACANIIDGAESLYVWDDAIHKEKEVLMFFKTREKNEKAIIKFVRKYHSYDSPCVIFLPIVAGDSDFLKWVEGSC